jgi:hypothetical protein
MVEMEPFAIDPGDEKVPAVVSIIRLRKSTVAVRR